MARRSSETFTRGRRRAARPRVPARMTSVMRTGLPSMASAAYRIALKLRRAEEKPIPQSTRAASFKRLLGGILAAPKGHHESGQQKGSDPTESKLVPHDNQRPKR